MKEEKLKKLLSELAKGTAEPVRPELVEEIKHRIPHRIVRHRGRMDAINIMIDLRVGKLTAAAVIIITMVLFASFFGGVDLAGGGICQDSKLLVKYCLGGAGRGEVLAGRAGYEHLVHQGKDVVYYGDTIDPEDGNAVLIQWKLSEGKYRVVFGDFRTKTVSAEELIELQARMLQKKRK